MTDGDLNELDAGFDVVIKPPPEAVESMDEVVVSMHTESGLLAELDSGITMEEAEQRVLDYLATYVPEARKAPLCGSSVYVDRGFLARDMPRVDSYLHYRVLDVSSFKEVIRRWYPKVYWNAPPKTGNHRALADIRESIKELRYYRESVMVPQPGPDTEAARAVAQQFGA